jgi:lysophospholipase L1-like esterase
MRPGKEFFFKAAAVFLSTVLTLLALEYYFTWYNTVRFDKVKNRLRGVQLETRASNDPILLYELDPDHPLNNSHGFRDREFTVRPAPGMKRVAVIGDSVAMGAGVAVSESFPSVLNRMFVEAGEPVEVYNFGVTGYNTEQEFRLLKTRAIHYHPDFVLWVYHPNDPADAVLDNANGDLGKYYVRPDCQLCFAVNRFFYFKGKQIHTLIHGIQEADWHEKIHFWKRDKIKRDLAEIRDWLSARDLPWLVIVIPVWPQPGDTFDPYYLIRSTLDMGVLLDELQIPYIDLFEFFRTREPTQYQIEIEDEWHPNAAGHAAVAEYVYPPLRDRIRTIRSH